MTANHGAVLPELLPEDLSSSTVMPVSRSYGIVCPFGGGIVVDSVRIASRSTVFAKIHTTVEPNGTVDVHGCEQPVVRRWSQGYRSRVKFNVKLPLVSIADSPVYASKDLDSVAVAIFVCELDVVTFV